MKISFLAPRYHTNQILLIKYLINSGHQVSFFVTRIGHSEDHSLLTPIVIKQSYLTKIAHFFIKSKDVLFDYNYGIPSIKELLRFKSNKYDLIIIRNPSNLMGISYSLWSRLIGTKIIFYTQREVHKGGPFTIKDLIVKIYINVFNAQWISPCLGDLKFKKMCNKINYLPFCASIDNYKKKWFLNDRVNILTIGKFTKRKNHLLLIRALSILDIKTNFRLTIVGECTTDEHAMHLEKVKIAVQKSGLNIDILINITHKAVKALYKTHDFFVLPSINEPASVSNLEAMSYGLPVITTDSNKTSCYTENGINGYVVKSNNLENLSENLKSLITNKIKIQEFGENSLKIVQRKHNVNLVYKEYFNDLFEHEE
jgi:glycosyltransferase involved in cell wall biosynthesis